MTLWRTWIVRDLGAAEDTALTVDGVPVQIELVNQRETKESAGQKATEIAGRDDALIVVGHLMSTWTTAALPKYFAKKPRLPVIAITETAEQLVEASSFDGYVPLFRLSPPNSEQASMAALFVKKRLHCHNIALVGDGRNLDYSTDLMDRLHKRLDSDAEPPRIPVVRQGLVESLDLQAWETVNIECIFFAGQFLSLEPFLDQVNRHFALAPPPHIVLSDSLAGVRLNEIPERLGRQAYLIYQTSAKDYLSGREEGSNVYGVHACQVVNQLVRRVNEAFESGVRSTPHKIRQFFGIHRVSDVRESLVRQMEIAVRDRVEFEVGAPGRPKEKLVFRTGGLVDNRSFFIWKLSADGPKDEYPPKSPSPNEQ